MKHLKHLIHLKHFVFPCILLLAVATLLLRTGFADAAPASSCGQWNIVKSPNVGSTSILNGVAAVSPNDVWAVGYSTGYQPLAEHWNGSSWHVVTTARIRNGGILYGLAVVSANDIWAVGREFVGLNGKGLTEHWDGTQWSLVPSPNVQAGSALFGVTAISTNNVWAVGFSMIPATAALPTRSLSIGMGSDGTWLPARRPVIQFRIPSSVSRQSLPTTSGPSETATTRAYHTRPSPNIGTAQAGVSSTVRTLAQFHSSTE